MAIMRLLLPDINIPATTAMEVLHPQGRLMALQSGANVIMPNVTNTTYHKLYELYPNKEKANETYSVFINKLHCISRTVSDTHGEHKKIA
jgi:biotin synthase